MKIARSLIALSLIAGSALAAEGGRFPEAPTFSTLITTPEAIEGLTGDNRGNLYVGTRFEGIDTDCKVYRVNIDTPARVVVGMIPAPAGGQCSTLGLAFDHGGTLYVTETDKIYRLVPNDTIPPMATVFAAGVPGVLGERPGSAPVAGRGGRHCARPGGQHLGRCQRA